MNTALDKFKTAASVPVLATVLTFNPALSSDANAAIVTLDFEQFSAQTVGVFNTTIGPSFTEDGFNVVANTGSVDIKAIGDIDDAYTGSVALIQLKTEDSYSLTRDGGGLFDALSLDLFTFNPGATGTVTIWGNNATLGTVSQDFTFTNNTTASLSNDFQGVSSLWLTQGAFDNAFQADNFVLETNSVVTPLPASGLLMLGALGGLAGARRVARSKQHTAKDLNLN